MTRSAMSALFGSVCLVLCAAAQAQSTPANPSASSTQSSTATSAGSSTTSSKSTSGQKDTSREAKEQQSQKHKCPKNGDASNPNCKERGKTAK
jgi:hypothetical protein